MEEEKNKFIESYKNLDFKSDAKVNSKEIPHFLKLFNKRGQEIEAIVEEDDNKTFDNLKLHINCFFQEALKLNTVSFLFGTGSSIPLGAGSIYNMPPTICERIKKEKTLQKICEKLVNCYKSKSCDKKSGCGVNLEKFLGDLIRLENIIENFGKSLEIKDGMKNNEISELIKIVKSELCELCKVPNSSIIEKKYPDYKEDPFRVHKEFIKKILARPVNLKRISIFTTNYDLAFERAMDNLGVIYIDGFVGNIKRVFKPEVYNYDYYFPASTTEGNVHRLDKVIHLYKLHGSLNWIECQTDSKNIFGIEQLKEEGDKEKSLLIYPQPLKEEETLGFPYSEMFRRFATIIQQPQNVLFVYGYGFGDEHINRVIYNALSISTFQLIVVSYNWTSKLIEFYERVKTDPRISFLIGEYLGDWKNFVFELLPDIKHLELEENILRTMRNLKRIEEEKKME